MALFFSTETKIVSFLCCWMRKGACAYDVFTVRGRMNPKSRLGMSVMELCEYVEKGEMFQNAGVSCK